MPRYGMLIDVNKCTGCYSCFLACKDEYCGNDYPGYSAAQPSAGQYWMRLGTKERGTYPKVKLAYIPTPCMHCADASCIKGDEKDAVYQRPDGIVIIDPEKAKGQKAIVSSCPYRVIYWNEERGLPQKCTFCAHLLDKGWKEPRCVETCPTGALLFGDLEDPESELSRQISLLKAKPVHPEFEMQPSVFYTGLPKRFIAGEVVLGDQDECAVGASLTLTDGSEARTLRTDPFGDFEFEGLEANREFVLKIELEGYAPRELKVKTRIDMNLGEIVLERT